MPDSRSKRPSQVVVRYHGIPHTLDLLRCRRALVGCQVEDKFTGMESLAGQIRISRSTVSRFFGGRNTSLAVTLKILGALGLQFDDVVKLCDTGDAA